MPVTIKDIAKVAGVSHTTVSRALNGNPAISSKTTARIQKLADEMGYTPSAVAQSLLSHRTQTIGMVVTSIADPFIVRVVEGVESVAQQAGYSVFLATSHNDPEQELEVVKIFQRRRVDAIIVTASRLGNLYSTELNQIQIPIVLINNQVEGEYLHAVTVDDKQGPMLAITHLLELGHRRIGYVDTANRPKSSKQRLDCYRSVLEQAQLPFDPSLVVSPPVKGDFNRGAAGLKPLLAAGATAAFCYNDVTAIGLMSACRQQGLVVPDDLSIVGFDDIEAGQYVLPQLTTVHQPRLRLGKMAANMVLDLLQGRAVKDQILPCELVVRGTTTRYQA